MKSLAPNTLLQNRYLIVHLIGKGGMGEVYLAVDQRLGSAIALKRTFYADDEQLGNAFEREARTLARLRHAVLPKVSDHFIENSNQFLVMEHISGDDLSKRLIATQKPFPLSWVLFWADQLLDALAYLHSHEPPIIHRDIKPQNLKLTDENNIVLLDFGLSKNSVNLNRGTPSGGGSTGSVVGYTPHYAPMEQIRGTGTNPRSDIYSLSATLYQLLTNIVPPDALTRADEVLGGKPDPIQPISEINSEIPRTISDVILKGMSISQEHRYSNAREMQKVLREAYASLQNAMAAQTIAYNAQDAQNEPDFKPLPPSHEKQADFSSAPFGQQPVSKLDMAAQTIPYIAGNSAPGTPEPDSSPGIQAKEPLQDFDATIRYDSQANNIPVPPSDFPSLGGTAPPTEVLPAAVAEPKQSGIQTEVFNAGDFEADESSKMNAPALPTPNFSGDQTTPYMAFEDQAPTPFSDQTQAVSGFDSVPQRRVFPTGEQNQQTRIEAPQGQARPQEQQFSSVPVSPGPATFQGEKKNSKGLIFAVLGGLFVLFVLALGAGGLGWYLTREPDVNGITNVSTPTPGPSVSASPPPEPTPEQANANTVINGSNTDVVISEPDNTGRTTNSANPSTPEKTPAAQLTPSRTTTPPRTPIIQQQTPRTPPRTPAAKTPAPGKTPRELNIPQ